MNNDMKGNFKSPNFNKQKDKQLSERIQSVLSKNRSLPNVGTSFNNEENQNEEENKSELQQAKENIQKKATAKIIEKASGGVVQGEFAEKAAELALKGLEQKTKKIKMYLIAGISVSAVILIIIMAMVALINDNEQNKTSNRYVTGEITEEELIDQLIYYGYCNSKITCKSKGVYKFYTKLKETYDKYIVYNEKHSSTSYSKYSYKNVKVPLNTALIIETINYYQEKGITFDDYNDNLKVESEDKETSLWKKIVNLFNNKKAERLNVLNKDIEHLAWAQVEYVHELCYHHIYDDFGNLQQRIPVNLYYYQISHDKFISYLAYGVTSSHPNFTGRKEDEETWPIKPSNPKDIENEFCAGPHNDTIQTSYSESTSTNSSSNNTNSNYTTTNNNGKYKVEGDGLGVEIANYALQFVGNPYVEKGTSLTQGADCSGFTMKVFEHFGITLPHHSTSQYSAPGGKQLGKNLEVALPGDLLVSNGHVALYIGNNKMVEAKGKNYGIVVSDAPDLNTGKWLGIVRYWK